MRTLLWLDDVRDPLRNDWLVFSPIDQPYEVVWVKSYKDFIAWIVDNGLPDGICFDHDLSDFVYDMVKQQEIVVFHEKTGYDCAKWLVNYCMDNELPLPLWNIQSANPAGAENIRKYLLNYMGFSEGE